MAPGRSPRQWIEAVGGRFHPTQFEVSQILAERCGITREDMDAYAVESHRRAQENWDNGHFANETVPVPIKDEEGTETGELFDRDEGIRPESTVEALAELPPRRRGTQPIAPDITAGNASQTSRRRRGDAHRRAGDGRAAGPADPGA